MISVDTQTYILLKYIRNKSETENERESRKVRKKHNPSSIKKECLRPIFVVVVVVVGVGGTEYTQWKKAVVALLATASVL